MIPQSSPELRARDFRYIRGILRSSQVARGALTTRLETALSEYVGVRYACAASSGTAALHLALLGLGVGPGDEVVVPSYTCAAVRQAVEHAGATPRLADIDRDTLNVTASTVRPCMTARTKAIVVTHSFGYPADVPELRRLGPAVVEDCATAVGSQLGGRMVGALGDVSVFSFYATKMLCAGEGGMVCSDDRRLVARVRDLNGVDMRPRWERRYNYKLSDLAAGLALSQLARLPAAIARRHRLTRRYERALPAGRARRPVPLPGATTNAYRFLIAVPRAPRLIERARAEGIMCDRPVYKPLHRYGALHAAGFPGTEAAQREIVSVPLYPALSDREAGVIVDYLARLDER